FFVPEEEGAVPVFVVNVRNPQGAAEIASRYIQLKFRPGLTALIEKPVVGVVCGVPIELIEFAVVILGSRFEHHQDGSTRPNSVVRLVIAIEGLKLRDGILRWQVHKATAASAIVLLAAIDHVNVVGGAGSIEADPVRRSQGIHTAKGGKGIRNTQTQGRQRSDVSTVCRELLNLCAANEGAYLTCFGLHLQGIRCD